MKQEYAFQTVVPVFCEEFRKLFLANGLGHRSETEVLKQAGARIVPVTPDSRQPCDKKPESDIGFLVSGYGRGRAPETEKAALVA